MNEFTFDLQRFADVTWSPTDSYRTWTCRVGGKTYRVTCSTSLTTVTGDPSADRGSVYLTTSSNLNGATVSISGATDLTIFRFVSNGTLYKATSTSGTLVARTVRSSSSVTLNSSGKELFRVVASDGSYKDYTLDIPGGATITTNSDGVPIFTVPSGANANFLYPGDSNPVIVSSGAVRISYFANHPVILGDSGPQVSLEGFDGNFYEIEYAVTKADDYDSVTIRGLSTMPGYTNPNNKLSNFKIGNFSYETAPSGTPTINAIIKDGKTYITTSNVNDTIKYNDVTYTLDSGTTITLVSENDGSNFYISGLNKGDKFTTSDGVTYIMGGSLLVAQYKDSDDKTHTRVGAATEESEISAADLNLSTSTFFKEICQTDGTITLSRSGDNINVEYGGNSATLSESNSSYYFVNPFNIEADEYPTRNYGKISRVVSGGVVSCDLQGYDPATEGNDKLTSVTVKDGLSVQFNKHLVDVTINVENAGTTFISRDSENDFTFETVTGGGISVDAQAVSLVSGTIHTDNTTQTLAASDSASIYSVSAYSGSDGIDLISDGSNVIVRDIDVGESFNVQTSAGTKNYTLLGGNSLLYELSGSSARVYDLGSPAGSTGVNATLGALGNGAVVIAPDSSKVIQIGSSIPSVGAVVFDNLTNPTAALASVKVDGSNFTLDTVRGAGSFASNVDSVSLTGGILSVNKSLVNDTVDIITRNATFRVTDTSSGNFTVSADASNPTVSGATNITLIRGSITAKGGQNIKLGASGNVLALDSASKDLTVSLTGSTFSVVSSDTAKFSYNGKNYSVDAGNGMTFSINDTAVTVSALDTGDVFTYDSTQHSVTPAGFLRNKPSPDGSIWIKESDNYSLSANSVSVTDLEASDNWGGLILVHDNKITVTPSGTVTGVLMNDDFSNTFGKVTNVGSNHYHLSANSNDRGTLDLISINSGDYHSTLSADKNFLNVSITSADSTLMVSDASSDSFQVTINGARHETGLLAVKAATLFNGSLVADSNISAGVDIGGQIVTSSETVTLSTGGADGDGTIAGLEVGHEFKVGGTEYTFTHAGLRNGVQLLRGSKPAHDATSMALSVVSAEHAEMVDMIGTASVSGVSINGSYPFEGFLVDTFGDKIQPSKLYGEVTGSSLAGFALTTVENGDAWEDGYTINVNDSTISIDAAFKNSNFKGIRSGAEFVLDTDDSTFIITDKSSGGAIIGGTNAITQTAGLVAAAESGLESITVGENTVYKAGGLKLDVSVLSGDATLSSMDVDDSFFIAGKEYSVKSELGLMTDNQIFINNSVTTSKQMKLSDVVDESKWLYVATGKDNILTIPPDDEAVNRWIILDEGKNKRYAQVTKTDGTYSLVKDTNNWTDSGYKTIAVTTNNTLNVEAGNFRGANISVQSSGAQFTVSDTTSYSVVDSKDGAIIGSARNINQTAGTILLSDARQSITAGGYTMSGAGDSVNVAVSGTSVSVGGLQTGENFKVNGTTYELLSNGRFQRGDSALWNGDTVSTTDGAINVALLTDAGKWNGVIQTDAAGNLTIDSGAATVLNSITSAYVVNKTDAASIYGTASKSGTTFTLGTTGRTPATATFNTITFTADAQPVSLSSDLVNVSLKAGSNEFMATEAKGGYTVNYDGKALSVDTAQTVSLKSGELVFDGASNKSQTIMANGQSVSAASESVNVSNGSEVVVSGITTANESVSVNTNAYSLIEGDGFTVHIKDGTTTVEDITAGDKFKIGGVTYTYTAAGLAKTASGSDKISYLLKSINPADNKLTLTDLQSTSEDVWLGVWQVTDGVVELTTEIESSVILVNDTTNPTKTYGQVVRNGSGGYTLSKYSGEVGDSYESPKSITITDGVTATISADYSDKPVKTTDATAVTVYKGGDSYTIGGTIEKFVPESMTFTPASDDDFTISGTTGRYVMTEAGLTKVIDTSTTMLWTTADVSNYVLPDESSWANMIRLTDDNGLDLTAVNAVGGANIIVDSAAETRWATLDYTGGVHDIKYLNESRLIPNIQTADGTGTFKVNFVTTFTTGNGTYTINEKAYTGSGLEIDTTATTSTLNDGTVTLNAGAQAVTSTNDRVAIGTTSGTITATATAGDWDNLGGLSDSDVFTVGDTSYKVYGASTLVQLNSSGNPVKLYIPTLSGGRISYTNITGTNYDDIIALNSDNQLDLREKLAVDSAIVVELRSGEINPTTRIAQFTFDPTANKYTVNATSGGQPEIMTEILLDTVKILSTDLDTTIKTTGTATFTINDAPFAAQDDLTIITEAGEPILTGGTVSLNGSTVKTRYGTTDEEIEATAGTVNVNVASSAVTISAMDAGDVFSVNSAEYTMTSVGLSNGTQLNCDAASGSITTADLTAGDWKEVVSAPSGILTINDATPADAFVANIGTPTAAVKYGTISLSGTVYTLTQTATDTALNGIILDNVTVQLPTTCAGTSITAGDATFSVTARSAFTIDSTTHAMTNVTAVTLTEGTFNATNGIPVTVSGRVITTTSGTMTVGIDDSGIFVGNLGTGEEFTVDGIAYKMTGVGLLDTTNNQLRPSTTPIYYLGEEFKRIIQADGSSLNLTDETTDALVFDSVSAPTTHLATLTFTGDALTLKKVTDGINSITLGANRTLTLDFPATINASGTTTVNGATFAGVRGALVLDATATSATLQSGIITLNATNPTAQATSDDNPLTFVSGNGIRATASAGKFTNISVLNNNDAFTFGKDYVQTAIGLYSEDDKLLNTEVTTAVNVADLTGAKWQATTQATGGELKINSETPESLIVDITDDKANCKLYGAITKSGDEFTLTLGEEIPTSVHIDGVKVTLPAECKDSTLSANDAEFSVETTKAFTIDATDTVNITDVDSINLTAGTLLATNEISITVGENVITTTSGSMTVGIDDAGIFVGDLGVDETFTVNGTQYKMTGVGLLDTTNNQLRASTTPIYYLGEEFKRIIQADGSSLNLTDETTDALVFDSVSAPTTHLATLTFTGDALTLKKVTDGINSITLGKGRTLTLDFPATINASGTTTVNEVTFAGRGEIVLDATADSSTLQSGTITLNATNPTAQATADENPLTFVSGNGIRATAAAGKFTNISVLNNNDAFTFGKNYVKTAIGLYSEDDKLLNTEVTTAVNVADLTGAKWQATTQATDGALTINSETPESLIVDITDDKKDCKLYGAITKTGEDFTLTLGDEIPASVHIDGVKVTLPAECQGSVLSANDATFSVTTSKPFTIDATDTVNINNVDSINLTAGTLLATNDIPVTIGENVITTTAGSMTVGIDDAGIFVGDLGVDETFTVNGTQYKMTGVGLLDTTNNQLRASTTPIYYLGEEFKRIIQADGSSLNLTDETTDALVFDSVTAPTTHMATLTFTGEALDLKTVNGGIDSITLGKGRTLTLDFPATINAGGTTTVNKVTFAGKGDIVLDATADSSTLQSGTITLNATNPTAQATSDDNPLTFVSGNGIRATASAGKFTNISVLNNNDAFTFGKDYVQTAIGLYSEDDKLLNTEVTTAVNVADLTGAKWQATTQATGGELKINSETPESLIVDITDDKANCKLYGALTKSGDDFTLTLGEEIPTSVHIDGVKVTLPAECKDSTLSANDAEFSVETTKAFTIDATDTVNINNVDSISLTAGTLLATNEIPVTIGENTITTNSGSMTVGIDDAGIFVGDLGTGEEFTVDGTTYKMTGVGLLDTTNNQLRASTTPIYYLGEEFKRIIQADGSSLNLTDETTDALVFDSVTAPTTHMATLTFDGDALNLEMVNGGIDTITLGANRTLTLDFPATVNASGTTTVNGATYFKGIDLVIDATADSSTLQSGTITLNATNPSAQATADDNPLTVTNGTIRATAAAGKFTNISVLNNNDAFTFGKNYVKTAIGLYSEDDKLLNTEVTTAVNVADLTGAKWQATTQATGGELTINSETAESLVVDITDDKKDCKLYGALTKSGDDFTLTLGDEIPASVHIDGVKVTLPAECKDSTLSANDAEFSVTTSKAFTIDATDTVNISNVDSITLTAGMLLATNDIPITIGENTITTTSGSMTVGIDDAGIFVGDLNTGEEFTVDGTTYKMTGVGLLDTTNNQLRASTTPIYYLGEEFKRIIQADGSSLNLTDETTDALVFDSVTAPTTHMATLTFDGDALNLEMVNGGIDSITLGKGRTLTLDFPATVNANGTTTVNGATYFKGIDLVIDATADSATLQSGTITLNATNPSAQATADENPLTVTNGTIRATASAGKFTNISVLNNNDAFTFGKNYVKTAIGLYSEDDKLLNTEVTTAVNVADLTGAKWQATTQATDGELTINSETPESLIVDITEDKKDCKLYGAITKDGDDFTLTLGEEIPTSVHIDGVKVTLPAECKNSTLSANDTEFSVTTSKAFTIDATDTVNINNVDSISLTAGTLLATNEIPVTIGENVITTTAGTMTVGIDDAGIFVGDLGVDETFTVNGTQYKMTGVGLLDTTNNQLRASTTPIYYLGEEFKRIIQADGSSLNLTDETTDALVFDSVSAPTTHMATLTFTGKNLNLQTVNGGINSITLGANRTLTINFPATINASGTTTVNEVTFAGRGDIVLDATADSATLQSGTITLNATNPSAQATADENPLTVTNGTIRATAAEGKFNHIEGLNNNDSFTFGKDYVKTAIGLYSPDDKLLNTEVTTAVNVADLTGAKWQATTEADDGELTINSETPESLIVDITEDKKDCKLYGAITKDGDDFALTLGEEIPTSVHIDGVKVTLPAECKDSTLSANDAEFSVETTKAFTIDATDTVNITDVDSINLTAGTLAATNEIPVTIGENVITTTAGSMTVGIDDAGIFVGNLNTGEEFTVDGVAYKMTGVGLLDTTNNQLRASTTPIYYLGEEFKRIIQADGSSLDLTDETTDALVFDSVTAPTTHMATLTFDGDALNLEMVNGGIDTITLGANRTLTLDFPATVNASGTTTVNGATYFKGIDLVIDATADSATLQSGTITLNATNPSAQATADDNPLTVTTGAIRATAADGKFNHIEGLNNNDAFTFGKDYVKTSIGLFSTSDKLLNVEVEKEVDVADLTGAKWQATTQATDGELTINSETAESLVVDITDDKANCKLYGAITKADDEFTLTLGDEIPSGVHIDGVKVTLPAECKDSTLSANDAEFSVETTKAFTIDATDTVNINNVDSINLTAGTLAATNYIPITVGENTITTTGGELTVGVDRQGAFVGGLTLNDTFTVDDENFKLTTVGLLNLTNNQLRVATTDTYHLGEDFDRIIAASGGTLDLTDQTEDAIVCNSVDSPSVRMANLTVDDRGFTLQNEDGGIDTVILGENETLTLDFPATVNASGTTTVNEVTFDGRGNLVIDADDDLATLRAGTITIRSGESAQATLDETALEVNAGTIRARAADGHFTNLSAVNDGDSFTFNEQTYTQSAVGLINGSTISEELAGGSVDLSKLDSAKWQNFFALSGGTLDLRGTISDAIILDNATAPTTKLADLTVSDHRINLRGGEGSDAIETVNVASGANLNVDFETQVTAPAGNVTVNSVNFNAASDVTLHSDGESATLYTGSVTLNSSNPSVNFTDDSSALSVANGSITTSAFDGVLVAVGDLQARDSFTLDGTTYTQSAVGLISDDLISENLAGTSIEISDLRAADDWSAFIAPDGDTLDLTTALTDALVLDNTTDPTVKLATLTVDIPTDADLPVNHFTLADNGTASDVINTVDIAANTNLDVDFITQITAPAGYVAANGQTYLGTTDLLLLSDGETSTLTTGTVTLTAGDTVNTTSDHSVTVHDGDGLSVTATVDSVRLDALNLGDDFTVDGTRYRISEGGLVDTRGKLWKGTADYSDGLTLNALTRESNWTGMVVAKDGVLSVDDDTLADGSSSAIVDDAANPTKVFGTLARDTDGYSITSDSLSSINLDGVKAQIDNKLAGIPITLNDTTLAVTASDKSSNFTADATGTYPTVDKVSAIELSNGTLQLLDGQTVTLADDASDYQIRAGNGTFHVLGETFTLDNLPDNSTVSFGVEDNSVSTVNEMPLASTVAIDGTTYTAPEDNAILRFDATDNEWYFHDYDYPEYQVTVDPLGNVLVSPGVRFRKVIASGRTLSDDGSIKFAADISKTPVTVINQNKSALTVTDANDYTWTENFAQGSTATFTGDGVEAESLTDVAGVSFNLQNTQSLTAGDTTVTATENDCEVGVGDKATSLSVDKPAQISAPADISLTLNAGDYSVNEVSFVTNGSTSATTITDGVKFDLAQSDTINYDDMTFSTDGTAAMDNSGGVSVTSGAVVTNTNDRAFTLEGDVLFDDRPFYSADASTVTIKPNGFDVGERNVRVLGDDDLYAVSLKADDVTNLDSIGAADGVTVNGLYDATVQTDKVGSLTTDDKTFSYDKSSVTFGYNDGAIASIDNAKNIVGDFTDNVKVNGDDVQLIGDDQVSVVASYTGVNKILMDREGTYTVNGKTYTIADDDDYAFRYSGGVVAGVESLENGSLVVNQDESGFTVSDDKITLSGNSEPVSLGIVDSHIQSVSGADGTINGLGNATVYAITNATINNKPINVSGSDTLDAIVTDKVTTNLIGLTDGATVNSAPDMRITTAENGTFTFPDKAYTLNDTLDATWDFLTNSQSHVKGFDNYSGSISGGDASGKTLNGDTVNAIGDDLVIYTDGDKITDITGMKDGSEVDGDFGNATLRIPEGNSTINGIGYTLEGDEDGAYVSGNGSIISGVDKDATLAVGKGGVYDINGKQITLQGGDSVTSNYDGAYKIDPSDPPITEKTDAEKVLARGENPVYIPSTAGGSVDVDLSGENDLAVIDSPNVNAKVQTGAGGGDSVVVRHGASADVELGDTSSTLIIPTAGRVTLENYNGDNAAVRTYDYSDIIGAVKSNAIKFGDGTMTLGDAIVTYDAAADRVGETSGNLYNAHGQRQAVGFTHTAGGTLDKSDSNDNWLLKGNYAESSDDTQKSGGSSITGGSGDDTILGGGGDYIDGGTGTNQIYLTDETLRRTSPTGATIVLNGGGSNVVHNFSEGFAGSDDNILIRNLTDATFGYGTDGLVLSGTNGRVTFENLPEDVYAHELKLTDGTATYNAAVAKENELIEVSNGNNADIFYGNAQGLSFSEYTGAVEMNLNESSGTLDGRAVQLNGINKVTGGAGLTTLIGSTGADTLEAGTGSASIWGNAGHDLLRGNTSADKQGATTFYYEPGDGRDTITNFDFMAGASDVNADRVMIDDNSGVTSTYLRGSDVLIGINNSADDYLTLANAKGQSFRLNNDLIAKVDDVVTYDGFTNCYVGASNKSTMRVGAGFGDVEIWMSDDKLEYHGTMYDGNFSVLDASAADGRNILAGGETDNLIIGGTGSNSIWGGYTGSNDTLVGGAGQNTFFFGASEGHDVIQGAHDGDLVSLEDIFYDDVIRADITEGGAYLEMADGSTLEIQSTANLDYRLADGTTYTVNRATGEWNQK